MQRAIEDRVEELLAENRKLREEAAAKGKTAAKALASYQQRALQMEIIRQQNEDLDRLAGDLAKAKRVEEERARGDRGFGAPEERVSRELLARNPDAAERHHRLLRAASTRGRGPPHAARPA